ncbi:MAG: hypothetical protein WDN48_20670 [Pseudolabrys sp.]
MRAEPSELPIVFSDVAVVAGAVTILDNVSAMLLPGAPDRPDRAERLRQDHVVARGNGG